MHGFKRRQSHDDEESAFVSMTDMTVSFLFIIMILLAFFASQFNDLLKSDVPVVPKQLLDAANAKIKMLDGIIEENIRYIDALEEKIRFLNVNISKLRDINEDNKRNIAGLEEEVRRLNELLKKLNVSNPLEIYVSASDIARKRIVSNLAQKVNTDILAKDISDISVVISTQGDALRFQGAGLFEPGKSELTGRSRDIIALLGHHLADELPCFTIGPKGKIESDCNPDLVLIDTVQVEGHTDDSQTYEYNLGLSNDRARSALNIIAPPRGDDLPDMLGFQNLINQPVLAVAGYGKTRPIASNATKQGKAANRRIDLRFIMYVPKGIEYVPHTVGDIEKIRINLNKSGAQ